ncbi:MAG: hypothetical protein J0M34_02315 [Alphaproteobacteria bacterium]|nr:hypothetical protein [Alphaproteobacteria bacterium]
MTFELDDNTIPPYDSFQEVAPDAFKHYFTTLKPKASELHREYLTHALLGGVPSSGLYCAKAIQKLAFYFDVLADEQGKFWTAQDNDANAIKNTGHKEVFRKFRLATNKLSAAIEDETKAVSEGIDDIHYYQAVDEAIEETKSTLKDVRERISGMIGEDMFGHNDPDKAMLEYLGRGYAVIDDYLASTVKHRFTGSDAAKEVTPLEDFPELPHQSLVQLSEVFQEQYPDTYDWLITTGWDVPSDRAVHNDRAITPIAKMRHEIEVMTNRLVGLTKFARSVIYRPSEYAREVDTANEEWNRTKLHPAGQEPPPAPIDAAPHQRGYDDLLPAEDGATGRYNGYDNLDEPLGRIVNLMPRIQGKPVTSAGAISSSSDLGKSSYVDDNSMFARAQNAAEILAYDAKTAYANAHNFIRKHSNPHSEVSDSQLLPHSLNGAQFCANELYSRIFQQSLALEEKLGELKKALQEQVGGGSPVGGGSGNVIAPNFGGGRGK